jgi:hypothetical protein
MCQGKGGYFGEKECFVEVGKAWRRCEREECHVTKDCKSTEQVWAMCSLCYGSGEIKMKKSILFVFCCVLLLMLAGFKPALSCEGRCEFLYNGCTASGTQPDVCESSFCRCMQRCDGTVPCILP